MLNIMSHLRPTFLSTCLSLLKPFSKKAKVATTLVEETLGHLKDALSLDEAKEKMQKSVEHFQAELNKIHTGRATPGTLDHISVRTETGIIPLKALATITVKDVHRLGVSLFDETSAPSVFSAIEASPMTGLMPKIVSERELVVTLPKRSKETIEGLIKVIGKEAERCKTSIRAARKFGMMEVKQLSSKDDQKRGEKAVTLLTESYVQEIDDLSDWKKRNLSD